MRNWQHRISGIRPLINRWADYDSGVTDVSYSVRELAIDTAAALRTQRPEPGRWFTPEVLERYDDIVEEFATVSATGHDVVIADDDEFDAVLNALYDWGDSYAVWVE